ncbi:MAG: hypothetical protein WBA74_09725 [Cyclobacteriaceae bacterium]
MLIKKPPTHFDTLSVAFPIAVPSAIAHPTKSMTTSKTSPTIGFNNDFGFPKALIKGMRIASTAHIITRAYDAYNPISTNLSIY